MKTKLSKRPRSKFTRYFLKEEITYENGAGWCQKGKSESDVVYTNNDITANFSFLALRSGSILLFQFARVHF